MKLVRLRTGEIIALVGAIGLLAVLSLDWFALQGGVANVAATTTGYASLGWAALGLIVFATFVVGWLALATVFERSPAFPVGLQTVAVLGSLVALVCVVLRLLLPPSLGVDAANSEVAVEPVAFAGLAFAAFMLVGSWRSLADERTDTSFAREQTEALLSGPNVDRPLPAVGEGTPW